MTTKWIKELERNVLAAAEELTMLRKKNRALRAKVQRLETQLAAAKDPARVADPEWKSSRQEIRAKVAELADSLGQLLQA